MLFKKKPQEIRTVKLEDFDFEGDPEHNEILFYRKKFDNKDVSSVLAENANIEVRRQFEAAVILGGAGEKWFNNGTHKIFDTKDDYKDYIKNGKSVEVVYVAKNTNVTVSFGTESRFNYVDEASNKVITIGGHGKCFVKVADSMRFFGEVVGSTSEFNIDEFQSMFRRIISKSFRDLFYRVIGDLNLTWDQFDRRTADIEESMGDILNKDLQKKYGLSVHEFTVKINLLDEEVDEIKKFADDKRKEEKEKQKAEEEKQKLKEYLAELERLDDKKWEREQWLKRLELEDSKSYHEVLKVIGNRDANKPEPAPEVKCPQCGMVCKPTDKFCPNCGGRVSKDPIICPDCSKVNEPTARFCAGCGRKLQ